MSITSRINEMSSHIEQAYDELQGLGADLTNVNKNIENISMVLDDIYDSLPSVSGEGTSLTLDNTRVGKIKSTLKGNTSQDGTPTPTSPQPINVVSGDNEINVCGKNLLNYVGKLRDNYGGLTSVINENGSITTTGIPTSSYRTIIEYDISSVLENGESYVFWQETPQAHTLYMQVNAISKSGGATRYYSLNTGDAFKTLVADTDNYNYIMNIQTEGTDSWGSSSKTITNKYMLELGTTPTDFEPYQGNTYNINLGVENLWDTSKLQSGYLNQSGSYPTTNPSFPNARYRLVYLYKGQSITTYRSTLYGDFRMRYIDVDTNLIVGTVGVGDNGGYCSSNVTYQGGFNNGTITALKDVILGLFDYGGNMAAATITYGTKIQAISPTPIELCKIGNYQDYFYKDSDKWYLHKEIGKVVLNGSESYGVEQSGGYYRFNLTKSDLYNYNGRGTYAISNYYHAQEENGYGAIITYQNRIMLYPNDTSITTEALFKSWLASNNTNVYYVLATPTGIEITYEPLITQLNLLEKAMSKDGQTNISQVNNDLPFIISASALKEWQESTSLNSTLSMVNPLSLGNTLNTQENDIQPIEVDNIEPLEEEENEESKTNS